jgi:hypothetical protein
MVCVIGHVGPAGLAAIDVVLVIVGNGVVIAGMAEFRRLAALEDRYAALEVGEEIGEGVVVGIGRVGPTAIIVPRVTLHE